MVHPDIVESIPMDGKTRKLVADIVAMHLESMTDTEKAMANDGSLSDDDFIEVVNDYQADMQRLRELREVLTG